ncbi:MAG: peptidoglycan DD-metalloendopeptidase family protein [Pseudomonadota bacterium]
MSPARSRPSLWSFCFTIFISSLILNGCGSSARAPIEDHTRPGSISATRTYTVLSGDTLYSIAFRYGLDYKRLAAANDIPRPYTIFAGQRLLLEEATAIRAQASAETRSQTRDSNRAGRSAATATTSSSVSTPASVAGKSSGSAPVATTKKEPAVVKRKSPVTTSDKAVAAGSWRWPATGRVVRRFDGQLQKGIDLAGNRGAPVVATAAGSIVYAGSGIAGYGLMLIVRHNDEYLSAYGHNERLLVREGDRVTAGQTIAELGSSGTDSVKLHFEIRRRGKPIDPLDLLPKR